MRALEADCVGGLTLTPVYRHNTGSYDFTDERCGVQRDANPNRDVRRREKLASRLRILSELSPHDHLGQAPTDGRAGREVELRNQEIEYRREAPAQFEGQLPAENPRHRGLARTEKEEQHQRQADDPRQDQDEIVVVVQLGQPGRCAPLIEIAERCTDRPPRLTGQLARSGIR